MEDKKRNSYAPLKVMLLVAARSITGPVKGIFQLVENVDDADVEYHLYSFKSNGLEPEKLLEGAREKNIKVSLLRQQGASYLSLILQASQEVRENEYDIIQTHGFKPSVIGFFLKLYCKIHWICFMHGTTSENIKVRGYNLIDNCVQRFSTKTILVSEAQRRFVYGGLNRERVKVLHNAINLAAPSPVSISPPDIRKNLGLPAACRLLVVIGRLSPEKGVDIFLRALSQLVVTEKNLHAVIVGDGQERGNLQAMCKEMGIEQLASFVGHTHTPGDYILASDVVVVPSRSEGIPNVVLEAMALRRPVIATAVGGVPEIIEDDVNGILIPSGKPYEMAHAIRKLLSDQISCKRLIENGLTRLQEAFSVEARIDKLLAVYDEVIRADS